MAKVLVVGVGYVGAQLALELSKVGHEVIGVCRSAKKLNIPLIQKDIFQITASDLPNDLDYIFYCISANERTVDGYRLAYPLGVQHIINCLNSHVKRFFYLSSTRVFPQNEGEWLNEQSLISAKDQFSELLIEAEQIVHDSHLPSTVLRLSGIYGPRRTGLLSSLMQGKIGLVKSSFYTNRIHLLDIVGILSFLMSRDSQNLNNQASHAESVDSLYLGSDCRPVDYNTLLRWLGGQLNIEVMNSEKRVTHTSKKVSNQKILDAGYVFKYPDFEVGYQSLISELKITNGKVL